jgi:hypothetical protein
MRYTTPESSAGLLDRESSRAELELRLPATMASNKTSSGSFSGLNTSVPCPTRGSVVAVEVDDATFLLGTVGEKVAGGLFEVVLEIDGALVSGVFRMSQLMRLMAVRSTMAPGTAVADFSFDEFPGLNEGETQ